MDSLVNKLRLMAHQVSPPSALLRTIIAELSPEEVDPQRLIHVFSEAFCFTEGQAYPIFGWFPEGTGPLKDADIDYLLGKRIGSLSIYGIKRNPGGVEERR